MDLAVMLQVLLPFIFLLGSTNAENQPYYYCRTFCYYLTPKALKFYCCNSTINTAPRFGLCPEIPANPECTENPSEEQTFCDIDINCGKEEKCCEHPCSDYKICLPVFIPEGMTPPPSTTTTTAEEIMSPLTVGALEVTPETEDSAANNANNDTEQSTD